jgi:hypothetical protein
MSSKNQKQIPPFPPVRGEGMLLETEGRVFQACQDFRQFVKKRHGNHYSDHILQKRWITTVTAYIQDQLQGNQDHFLAVLDWYKLNVNGQYIPECFSLPGFCQKFHQIEKARSRETGDEPVPARIQVTTVSPSHTPIEDTW